MICKILTCSALALAPQGYVTAIHQGEITHQKHVEKKAPHSWFNYIASDMRHRQRAYIENGTDIWHQSFDTISGDCEDYALTVRRKLNENGFHGGYLATTQDNSHIVLLVPTKDRGIYVVDINYSKPRHIKVYDMRRFNKIEEYGTWYTTQSQ